MRRRMQRRGPWPLQFLAAVLTVLVVASSLQAEPQPALHGRGLAVTLAVMAFAGLVAYGLLFRTQLPQGGPDLPFMVATMLAALALALLQPDGAGILALYITLGTTCVRLEPKAALGGFALGMLAISGMQALLEGGASLQGILVADASAVVFFFMGYLGRRARLAQRHAEQLLAELEQGREAQAQAIALRERARTAREMHDVLAHSLSALAVQLEGARLLARRSGADGAVVDAIERSHHLARSGLEEARRAIEALRGGAMPGPDRLAELAAGFQEQTGVPTELALEGEPRDLPSEARLAVYRTAQEALTNVRRHSDAARVRLELRYADDGTWLSVRDRGVARAARTEAGLGYGLTGMRERAELLGGRLAAGPTADGFEVELFLPAAPDPSRAAGAQRTPATPRDASRTAGAERTPATPPDASRAAEGDAVAGGRR